MMKQFDEFLNPVQQWFHADIEDETVNNDNFRKVLFTTPLSQLVVMSLLPGEEIGKEKHKGDQFIRIEEGKGIAIIEGQEFEINDDDALVIPANSEHNIINTGDEDMKLYAVYTPPEHNAGQVDEVKP